MNEKGQVQHNKHLKPKRNATEIEYFYIDYNTLNESKLFYVPINRDKCYLYAMCFVPSILVIRFNVKQNKWR